MDYVLNSVLDQKFSKSKIFFLREFSLYNFSIKHDILRFFAKIKFLGENFVSPNLSLTVFWTLSWTKKKVQIFFKENFFFTISPSNMLF